MTDANEPEKKIQTGPKDIHSNPVICLLLIPFCSLLTCHLFIVASRHLEYIYYFVFACFVMIAVIILEQLLASGYFRYK